MQGFCVTATGELGAEVPPHVRCSSASGRSEGLETGTVPIEIFAICGGGGPGAWHSLKRDPQARRTNWLKMSGRLT